LDGFEDQINFPLNGRTWSLTYGPRQASLPFILVLRKFNLGLDPGTENPASYASDIATRKGDQDPPAPYTISMNHPLHEAGYTLYQASYFPSGDGKYTSVFSVGRDPGLPLKYGGALIMVLGIIFMFWFKNPAWKKRT
jgi:cytochrome c biogenesis protein ResB